MGAKKKKNKIFVNVPEELREEPESPITYYTITCPTRMATTGIPSLAHVQVNSSELGGTLDPPATVPAPAVNHVAARARRHSDK